MFAAFLLVCSLGTTEPSGNNPNCIEFVDSQGPYETEKLCRVRVDQMVLSVTPTIPFKHDLYFKCVYIPSV